MKNVWLMIKECKWLMIGIVVVVALIIFAARSAGEWLRPEVVNELSMQQAIIYGAVIIAVSNWLR